MLSGHVRSMREHVFVITGLRKPDEYARVRTLRTDGMSIKRIAAAVGVSPSTVHKWTTDIVLTPEQRARNVRGPGGPQCPELVRARAAAWSATCRTKREQYQMLGRTHAREHDPLHLAGCMLYWAEGSKFKNTLEFSNSDPAM